MRETQCQCTHLTSFGSDFVVPPNSIDFNNVFTAERFLESMPVFCTVTAVMLLYVGVMVWARREDKKDLVKVCRTCRTIICCSTGSEPAFCQSIFKGACDVRKVLFCVKIMCSGARRRWPTTCRVYLCM